MTRVSPPLAIIALIACALIVLAFGRSQFKAKPADERCAVLKTYIAAVVRDEHSRGDGRPVAFQREPEDPGILDSDVLARDVELRARLDSHPFSDLYRSLAASKEESPIQQCPSLKRLFESKDLKGKIFLDRFEGQRALDADGNYPVVFLRTSMPAISTDGKEAILFSGLVYAPLGGGGSEVYLRRDRAGHWQVLYQSGTWIS